MGKPRTPVRSRASKIALDGPLGTTETLGGGGVSSDTATSRRKTGTEKVDLAFAAPAKENEVVAFFKQYWGIMSAVGTVALTVFSVVWWASGINTNVDNLKSTVADIKSRTDDLFRTSVQQQGRLDVVEKSVENIKTDTKPAYVAPATAQSAVKVLDPAK